MWPVVTLCSPSPQDAADEFGNFTAIMDFINASPSYGMTLKYARRRAICVSRYAFPACARAPIVLARTDTSARARRYAHMSEYFSALVAANASLPTTKFYDGFPYSLPPFAYWSGFYTSRPVLKGQSRSFDALLRATERFYVLARGAAAGSRAVAAGLTRAGGTLAGALHGLFGLVDDGRRAAGARAHAAACVFARGVHAVFVVCARASISVFYVLCARTSCARDHALRIRGPSPPRRNHGDSRPRPQRVLAA